jgi:hypothetical protein
MQKIERITIYQAQLNEMKRVYAGVISEGILLPVIGLFKERFTSEHISDIKILDYLFWQTGKNDKFSPTVTPVPAISTG